MTTSCDIDGCTVCDAARAEPEVYVRLEMAGLPKPVSVALACIVALGVTPVAIVVGSVVQAYRKLQQR